MEKAMFKKILVVLAMSLALSTGAYCEANNAWLSGSWIVKNFWILLPFQGELIPDELSSGYDYLFDVQNDSLIIRSVLSWDERSAIAGRTRQTREGSSETVAAVPPKGDTKRYALHWLGNTDVFAMNLSDAVESLTFHVENATQSRVILMFYKGSIQRMRPYYLAILERI
jgi:hypothetical protein